MRILVIGGTGFIGTALAHELLDRGHTVTVLARTPTDETLPNGSQAVAGDVTDYDSIEPAVAEQDAIVNLVALSPLFTPAGGNEMHEQIHLTGTENVVTAAQAHGVSRLIQVSALGADPEGPTAYIRSKGNAEQVVCNSELDWTIVRPSVIFGEEGEFIEFTKTLTTPYVTGLPGGGTTRFQPLWVGDFAPMLADIVSEDRHTNEIYEVGGPDVLTLAEVASLAYHAEGQSLTVLPIPMVLARLGLTVAGIVPGIPLGLDQYRSLKFDNTVTENDIGALGRTAADLRPLADYLGVAEQSSSTVGSQASDAAEGGAS